MPLNGTGAKYGNRNSLPGISYGIEQGFVSVKRPESAWTWLDRQVSSTITVFWIKFGLLYANYEFTLNFWKRDSQTDQGRITCVC